MNNLTTKQAASAVALTVLTIGLVCWLIWWLTKPLQIGGDAEVVKAVDALFTAVTARDERLLGECEQRLHTSKEAGQLATEPADYLDGIIRKARAGRWQSAAERLYDFMKVQRRDRPRAERNRQRGHPNLVRNIVDDRTMSK